MAITSYLYNILIFLKKNKLITPEKTQSIFEIGEQNWYGDVSFESLNETIKNFAEKSNLKQLTNELEKITLAVKNKENPKKFAFDVAKIFYKTIFAYKEYKAIDLHGTADSFKFDLNSEYNETTKYDLITNIGTSEHIFNQLAVFKTIHNLVKKDGIIIHQLPGQGYYDHGFFNYHPTFFFDLALANNYTMGGFWMYDNNENKLINVHNRENYSKLFNRNNHPNYYDNIVLYKATNKNDKFNLPIQNIYSKSEISESEKDKWDKNKK